MNVEVRRCACCGQLSVRASGAATLDVCATGPEHRSTSCDCYGSLARPDVVAALELPRPRQARPVRPGRTRLASLYLPELSPVRRLPRPLRGTMNVAPAYVGLVEQIVACEVCDGDVEGCALFDVWYDEPDVGVHCCARCASLALGSVQLARGGVCERRGPSELQEIRRTLTALEDAARAVQASLDCGAESWSVRRCERIVERLQAYRAAESWAETGATLRRVDWQERYARERASRRAACPKCAAWFGADAAPRFPAQALPVTKKPRAPSRRRGARLRGSHPVGR